MRRRERTLAGRAFNEGTLLVAGNAGWHCDVKFARLCQLSHLSERALMLLSADMRTVCGSISRRECAESVCDIQ